MLKIRKEDLRLRADVLLPVLALGVSPFIMQSTEAVLSVSFNTSLLRYGGDIAVGAMTILSSMMQFTMLPLQGLTQGVRLARFRLEHGDKRYHLKTPPARSCRRRVRFPAGDALSADWRR